MDQISRKALLKPVKRVVIKVGSAVLTARDGLNRSVIQSLTNEICGLRRKGIEVILVSSGAISSGLKKIGLSKRPESLWQKQAVAAVGQISLNDRLAKGVFPTPGEGHGSPWASSVTEVYHHVLFLSIRFTALFNDPHRSI